MVDPNMPWSLKGISDEAREFAKLAADGSGVPVGAWISSVIRAAAEQEEQPAEPDDAGTPAQTNAGPAEPDGPSGSTIERAVQIVSDFGFEPEGPAHDTDLLEDPEQLQGMLNDLERQIDQSETLTNEALEPLTREVERIRSRLQVLRGH